MGGLLPNGVALIQNGIILWLDLDTLGLNFIFLTSIPLLRTAKMEAAFRNMLQEPLEEPQTVSSVANVLSIQPLQSAPALPDE